MKKFFTLLTILMATVASAQSIALNSHFESTDAAKLEVIGQGLNLAEGFTIEIANMWCGNISDSAELETPKTFSLTDGAGFEKRAENHYLFTTPFSSADLQTKWFKWRVVSATYTTEWTCFSWSDYCEVFLTQEGKCK